MAQVTAKILEPTSRPLSEGSGDDKEGAVRRGFRVAEFALNTALTTALTTANVADFLWNATSPAEYDVNHQSDEEQEPATTDEQPSGSTDIVNHRDRSRSRDDSEDNNVGHILLRRGASRSRSSSPASSAKTTPKKK